METSSSTPFHPHTLLKWALVCITIVILGAIFIGGYGGLNTLMNLFGRAPAEENPAPSGTLLLSVGAVATTTGAFLGIAPLTLSLVNGMPDIQSFIGNPSEGPAFQYNVSHDVSYGTFLATSLTKGIDTVLNVYRANLHGVSTYDDIMTAFKKATPITITSNTDAHREFPVVSSTGAILYSSLSAEAFVAASTSLDTLPADSWNIMMVDVDGAATKITEGLRPKWIDAGHFAYLKNDGIYLYDLAAKTEQRIWESGNTVSIVNGFNVSGDGTLVAFSDPGEGGLAIIRVLNWTANIVSVIDTVAVVATNLVFSPDDSYLAMLALRPNNVVGQSPVPRIEYFSIKGLVFIPIVIPFDTDVITSIYVTDWIK